MHGFKKQKEWSKKKNGFGRIRDNSDYDDDCGYVIKNKNKNRKANREEEYYSSSSRKNKKDFENEEGYED